MSHLGFNRSLSRDGPPVDDPHFLHVDPVSDTQVVATMLSRGGKHGDAKGVEGLPIVDLDAYDPGLLQGGESQHLVEAVRAGKTCGENSPGGCGVGISIGGDDADIPQMLMDASAKGDDFHGRSEERR